MPRHERSLLVQFRSGTMPLRIETGRWQGKPVEERLCLVCNRGVVEDEFHFLCECQTYCALREDLFKSVNEFCPDFEDMEPREKFVYILKHENRKLAKFLIKACDRRRNLLYENV